METMIGFHLFFFHCTTDLVYLLMQIIQCPGNLEPKIIKLQYDPLVIA